MPAGSVSALVIASAGHETVVEKLCVVVAATESVTRAVNEVVPAVVGVPLRTPVDASDRPAGGVPEETVHV